MVTRAKATVIMVVLSLLVIASMAVVEARLLQGHFFNSAVEQVKNSAVSLPGSVVTPPG